MRLEVQREKGMKTTVVLTMLGLMLPCMVGAQDSAGQNVAQGVKFEFGATLNSVLSDTVDARKCKPGDIIKAKASEDVKAGGIVVIPRGAKLIGHVTEAQPAAKAGEQARLGFVFDRADLKDGRQIPLRTAFYALAAPQGASSNSLGGGLGGGFGGAGGAVGNMVSTASDDASALGSGGNSTRQEELKPSPGAIGGLNSSGTLYASSRGVFGLEDISLEPNTVPSGGSSVILANARSVHLGSGTRMLLSVESGSKP
jgi:hypothetical protein